MNSLTGVVDSKSANGKSIKINGDWFGAFSPSTLSGVNVGDTVQFNWDLDKTGRYKNIKGAVNVGGKTVPTAPVSGDAPVASPAVRRGFPVDITDHARSIIRQNALTNARELFCWALDPHEEDSDSEKDAKRIISIARIFEDYTSGEGDLKAAEQLLTKTEK